MEALINFVVCVAAAFVCLCRLGAMDNAKLPIIISYASWMTMLLLSAFSFWFVTVHWVQILFGTCVLVHFALGFRAWQNGPPEYTRAPSHPA